MIVTRDMLVANYASQKILNEFYRFFPNGLDFKYKNYHLSLYRVRHLITECAKLFSYTGIFTALDDVAYGNTNTVDIIHQANFVNGYLENLPNGNPALISYDCIAKYPVGIEFYKKGINTNFSPTLPATISYHSNKQIVLREFKCNNKFHDPLPGIPSSILYHENGNFRQICHYKNDLCDNPYDNTPALRMYNSAGNLYLEAFYNNGLENDPLSGKAAVTYYNNDGSVKDEYHFKNGVPQ